MLYRFLYSILITLLALPAAIYLRFHGRYRPLLQRFSPTLPNLDQPPVWIQAASLGEVNTALPLLKQIRGRWPEAPLLLTTSTLTGMARATEGVEHIEGIVIAWFPFDLPIVVNRFFRQAAPRCLILVETELWPNVLARANRGNVPITIVNGRISERHFERYCRVQGLFEPLLNSVAAAMMQTQTDVDRISQLGVQREKTSVLGSTKFDGAQTEVDRAVQESLREALALSEDSTVLLFGSTRPGDEALAAQCWSSLLDAFPALFLILVPRHLDRIEDAMAPFRDSANLRWSHLIENGRKRSDERVLFVDTMGELGRFYSIADVAVVGGSFSEDVQGHNPIEPTALGVATVFGPCMKNFELPARILLAAQGARQVESSGLLLETLKEILASSDLRDKLGRNGRQSVLENRGALAATLDALARILDDAR